LFSSFDIDLYMLTNRESTAIGETLKMNQEISRWLMFKIITGGLARLRSS